MNLSDDDRMPVGQTLVMAPRSMPRNNTSASAARPRISVGLDAVERA
jgi:hypothetical protein